MPPNTFNSLKLFPVPVRVVNISISLISHNSEIMDEKNEAKKK